MAEQEEILHIRNGSESKILPNATATLVLGILSIIFCFGYGILGLILGIIALVISKKDVEAYKSAPSDFLPSSYTNLKAGRTCAIIGLVASAVFLFAIILMLVFVGTIAGLAI